MKCLIYVTKRKPYLFNEELYEFHDSNYAISDLKHFRGADYTLNGKIIAEFDGEVDKITVFMSLLLNSVAYRTERKEPYRYFSYGDLLKASCLNDNEIYKYLGLNDGYAIHIKNLKNFEKPKELKDFYIKGSYRNPEQFFTDEIQINGEWFHPLKKAPQNMMHIYDKDGNKYFLISIRSEWVYKILNGEKIIEVRKQVLKDMEETK